MLNADVESLHGRSVLVRPRRESHNPATAVRGTIEVRPADSGGAVTIELEFPQMFGRAAHHRTIVLNGAEIERLRASGHDGVYEYVLDGDLT